MPHVPVEKYAKPILDRIRMCTDLLNLERYLQDNAAGAAADGIQKPPADTLAGTLAARGGLGPWPGRGPGPEVAGVDANALRRSLVPIVFIIGGPGSGKGVQSELLVKRFGLTHISLGDLVRHEIQAGSSVGRFAAPIVAAGNLVPKEVILELLKRTMLAKLSESRGFLVDGFPRDEEQAVAFESEVARAHLVIFLTARDSTLSRRLAGRGRADDDEEVVANRLRVFHQHTDVLRRAFGSRCKVVSAEGEPLAVFSVVSAHMCNMLNEWGFKTAFKHCPEGYVPLHRLQRR